MFYLKEIKLRFLYSIITFLFIIKIIYMNRQNLFILLSYSALYYQSSISFFYTHPIELLKIYIFLVLFYSLFFYIQYLQLIILDYLTTSFHAIKITYLKHKIFLFFVFYIYYNNLLIFKILPLLWFYFEDVNNFFSNSQPIFTFLELKLDQYFFFIFHYVFLFNIYILSFFWSFFMLYKKTKEIIINYKKYYYYVILLFTLVFVFDLMTILISFFFLILIELFVFYLIISKKTNLYNLRLQNTY